MDVAYQSPEDMVLAALGVLQHEDSELLAALDQSAAPLYVTDADGLVTYFNEVCIEFAGRTPVLRADRWCVTWKLFTNDGEFLPHEKCPMAAAIQERRPIRGLTAIAERPNGTRVPFMPYPTPILKNGALVGAVNILSTLPMRTRRRSFGYRPTGRAAWRETASTRRPPKHLDASRTSMRQGPPHSAGLASRKPRYINPAVPFGPAEAPISTGC